MRKVAMVTVSVVIVAGLGLSGAVSGASVRRENSDFCEALTDNGNDITAASAGTLSADNAAVVARGLRRAANEAPRKVKKAMKKLAKIYNRIADGDGAGEVLVENAVVFGKTSAIYAAYFLEQCAGVSLPDTNQ